MEKFFQDSSLTAEEECTMTVDQEKVFPALDYLEQCASVRFSFRLLYKKLIYKSDPNHPHIHMANNNKGKKSASPAAKFTEEENGASGVLGRKFARQR
ncbi:hypothetical protein CEXT_521801 [Caerostris extrusa]|uniref:Uncharacterized protein n=1 Tax=Caerostris extrusa TaxID=172846 RepID=A0AAV4VAR7_CAEEX|nr:hypothetical protein CEXT_521801 [Caerostris extrusa]